MLKRPIVCAEGVKSNSNFGSPDNLSNFGAHGQARQQMRHAMMMQEPKATGTALFSTKRSTCTTTVSCSSCSTRTRLSQAPSRPVWSASPKTERRVGIFAFSAWSVFHRPPKRSKATFSVVSRACATKQPSAVTPPAICSEFVPSAVRGDSNLVNYHLPGGAADAACGLLAALGPWLRSQGLLWLLWPHDTGDIWNVQRVPRARSRTGWHWLHKTNRRIFLSTSTWWRLTRLTHTRFEAKKPQPDAESAAKTPSA